MLDARTIALIEPDERRRAQISYSGAQAGLHLEPFESVQELGSVSDKYAVLFHDSGCQLGAILDKCARAECWLPIIAYAAEPASIRVAEVIFAGALDYLSLPFSLTDLTLSLERARNRNDTVGASRARAAKARSKLEILSGREHQVVAGMTEGLTNKAIARRLQISPRTVEIHRANALGKLGVGNSSEAILLAAAARAEG